MIVHPDVALWATGYLRAQLATRTEPYAQNVHVGIVTPEVREDRMVIVRRDGGPRLDQVREAARLNVRVWGANEQECTDLANLTRAILGAAPDGKPVCRVDEQSGPSPVLDATDRPLRMMVFELIVRGTDLD